MVRSSVPFLSPSSILPPSACERTFGVYPQDPRYTHPLFNLSMTKDMDMDMEKTGMHHLELERTISEGSSRENDARIDALTPEEQKKVLWRIDVRLVLTLGFMYCEFPRRECTPPTGHR